MATHDGLISSEFEWDDVDEVEDDTIDVDLELVVLGLEGTTVVDDGDRVREVPGAEQLLHLLSATGVKVALITNLPQRATDALIDALGWRGLADVTLAAAEAGRGRPYPDLPLTALLRTGASSVEGMVVVGDTSADVASGIAAGAGLVVGVLTGEHDEATLLDAGADVVLASVAELASLLGFDAVDTSGATAVVAR